MKTLTATSLAVAFGLLVFSAPFHAQRTAADYDNSKRITEKVTITDFKWTSPHCRIEFDFKDDKDPLQHWILEAPSSKSLRQYGWILGRESLKAGDTVTISFYAAKDGTKWGIFDKAVLADGTVLRSSRTQSDSPQ